MYFFSLRQNHVFFLWKNRVIFFCGKCEHQNIVTARNFFSWLTRVWFTCNYNKEKLHNVTIFFVICIYCSKKLHILQHARPLFCMLMSNFELVSMQNTKYPTTGVVVE